MPSRFLSAFLVTIAASVGLSGQQPSSPDYRASMVCDSSLDKTRLVVHAIDLTGEPLPGGKVEVTRGSELIREAQTDDAGRAVLDGLPTGKIRLEVNLEGFRIGVTDVRLERSCTTAITVPLELGTLGGPAAP